MPRVVLGLGLACVLFGAGCGFGSRESAPEPATRITRADLSLMVVPKAEIGPLAKSFVANGEPTDNREAADATPDPEDTAESLTRAGRIAGHRLAFVHPKLRAGRMPQGTMLVGTETELFGHAVSASQYLHDQVNGFHRFASRVVNDGMRLGRVSSFDVSMLGREAMGIRAAVSYGPKRRAMLTLVAFASDRIVGSASILRSDRRDVGRPAMELAEALDGRIQKVLAGELAKAEPRVLEPRSFALEAADFPSLTLREAQAGYRKSGLLRAYLREFDVVGGRLGKSTLFYLRTVGMVFPSREAAAADQRYFASTKGRRSITLRYLRALFQGTDYAPHGIRTRTLPTEGGDVAAYSFSFKAPRGRIKGAMLSVGSGRMRSSVTVMGPAQALVPSDVLVMQPTLRERVEAA